MAVIKVKKEDPRDDRYRVIVRHRGKQQWHTAHGKKTAEKLERELLDKIDKRTYVAKSARMTLKQVADAYLAECRARGRATATLCGYGSALELHILPAFGEREVGSISKSEVRTWFTELLAAGKSADLVNNLIRKFKAVLFHAVAELEVLDRNVLARFKPYRAGAKDRRASRGTFTETEVQRLIGEARPHERALVGLLCFTGLRPGEAYALRWQDVDLTAGSASISRSWDWRGKQFKAPKTAAGVRTVALSGWLVSELKAHQERTGGTGEALVFATRTGAPLNPSNVRRDIWLKLVKRAKVQPLDMYSLRHTFASIGRVSGEEAFNVSRAMGHSRSTLVDAVYAHSLPSGMAGLAERVTARALGLEPKLRVIEGGKSPDVRQTLDDSGVERTSGAATA
ncbi:MAG TPA: tyrosine-type recombinase/integrase [Steroidobacteraceae bacterium]|jgi:integrase|nr:tyrosine-type recombinase/integrase [Steroidobacteraceae bacterium]